MIHEEDFYESDSGKDHPTEDDLTEAPRTRNRFRQEFDPGKMHGRSRHIDRKTGMPLPEVDEKRHLEVDEVSVASSGMSSHHGVEHPHGEESKVEKKEGKQLFGLSRKNILPAAHPRVGVSAKVGGPVTHFKKESWKFKDAKLHAAMRPTPKGRGGLALRLRCPGICGRVG